MNTKKTLAAGLTALALVTIVTTGAHAQTTGQSTTSPRHAVRHQRPGKMHTNLKKSASTAAARQPKPMLLGTITAINGTTLTISAKERTASNTATQSTYTVDAQAAHITKPGTSHATLSSLSVGEQVRVRGTINGTQMTATTIIDRPIIAKGAASATAAHTGKLRAKLGKNK